MCNICFYCLVGCGILMYSFGDGVKNVQLSIIYIEGDFDYFVNCGMLCLKGVSLIDFIYSLNCLMYFEYCVFGLDKWEFILWNDVFDCIVKLMKVDCDVNFVEMVEDGVKVNCWFMIGMLVVLVGSNEVGYLMYKIICSFGMFVFDNQVCV